MLSITRNSHMMNDGRINKNEDKTKITIFVGNEEIEIQLVTVSGNQAKIGITAPVDMKIMRNELLTQRLFDASHG